MEEDFASQMKKSIGQSMKVMSQQNKEKKERELNKFSEITFGS